MFSEVSVAARVIFSHQINYLSSKKHNCYSEALFFHVFVAGDLFILIYINRGRMFHDTTLRNLVSLKIMTNIKSILDF